jgi:hypothetical protein
LEACEGEHGVFGVAYDEAACVAGFADVVEACVAAYVVERVCSEGEVQKCFVGPYAVVACFVVLQYEES